MSIKPIHVVGGGLAGSEAAWQAAEAGVPVILHEMRPVRGTDAHQTDHLAELVCSNSFRADDWTGNAVGLLHAEMRARGMADHQNLVPVLGHRGGDVLPEHRQPGANRVILHAGHGHNRVAASVLGSLHVLDQVTARATAHHGTGL